METAPPIPLARLETVADAILGCYDEYSRRFWEITARAADLFLARDWPAVMRDGRARLALYRVAVDDANRRAAADLGDACRYVATWLAVKERYAAAMEGRYDADIAETFFNSVSRRFLFGDVGRIKFQDEEAGLPPYPGAREELVREYRYEPRIESLLRKVLDDCPIAGAFEDPDRDGALTAERIVHFLRENLQSERFDRIEMVRPVFYRNKAAFLIGRVRVDTLQIPLVLLLRNRESGVHVHTVLIEEAKAGRLFSNTRSSFLVDARPHRELVSFLWSPLPEKQEFEFYAGMGHFNHARTKLYDELFHHLERTGERFHTAPGARGKVMIVFSLPTFPMVFKVIRDVFDPPKTVTRDDVLRKYAFVRVADRAGRMLDALTFGDMRFRAEQFDDAILAELLSSAPSVVARDADRVTIRHLYAQRQVTPLPELFRSSRNIHLQRDAIVDWGYLIKDLASVNIFLGDYLLKNFGLTSYGRVVSFDYDELELLTTQNFRRWPRARNEEEELTGDHIESMVVADDDVFPEQFEKLLGIPLYLMPAFRASHADLFTPAYYRGLQERLRADEVIDISSAIEGNLA